MDGSIHACSDGFDWCTSRWCGSSSSRPTRPSLCCFRNRHFDATRHQILQGRLYHARQTYFDWSFKINILPGKGFSGDGYGDLIWDTDRQKLEVWCWSLIVTNAREEYPAPWWSQSSSLACSLARDKTRQWRWCCAHNSVMWHVSTCPMNKRGVNRSAINRSNGDEYVGPTYFNSKPE